jgi:RNA polymerase sigma-70 factor, ECF subfamily
MGQAVARVVTSISTTGRTSGPELRVIVASAPAVGQEDAVNTELKVQQAANEQDSLEPQLGAGDEVSNVAVAREPQPDDDNVARAIAGDRVAFRALYTKHRGVVVRVICRMGVPRSDLEDAVQEVFVQVHRSLRDFRGQSKFSTWVHRITVNVILMQRRALKSRPQYADEPEHEVAGDHTLPDEDAERRERLRAFDRLLEKVAEKKRTVFVLHDIEGMSPQEISEIVDAPVLTVRTRLFYARRELEALLATEPALEQIRGAFTRSAQ